MRWNVFFLIVLSGLALLAIAILVTKPAKEPLEIILKTTATVVSQKITPTAQQELYVDIAGAIRNPGVYRVNSGSRVDDVIQLAGGITTEANLQDTSLNRAALVSDGQKIIIPTNDKPLLIVPTKFASDAKTTITSGKISINSADKNSLMTIKGIGEKTADKIVARRETKGLFTTMEQLKEEKFIQERYWENFLQSATL